MKAHQKRLFVPLTILLICLSISPASGQRAKGAKPPPKMPMLDAQLDDPQTVSAVEKLMQQTGQKYSYAGRGVWIVPRNGTNLGYFQVVLSLSGGTLVTQVTVIRGKGFSRVNEAAIPLLQLADRLEYVRVSLDKNNTVFVRNEARVKSLDLDQLVMNIDHVAAGADQISGEVKRFQ
jgi:hypothetical protein